MGGDAVAPLAGVILAAGLSRRFGGRNKLLARVSGEPMVAAVARLGRAAGLRPLVAVTGYEAEAVERALAGLALDFVRNPRPSDGLASSLNRGIGALPPGTRGAVVLLGDMPWVRPDTIRRLVDAFDPERGHSVCVPRYLGRRGNPVLWGAEHFAVIRTLEGDAGAGRLLPGCGAAVVAVDVDDAGVLRDVDRVDDSSMREAP